MKKQLTQIKRTRESLAGFLLSFALVLAIKREREMRNIFLLVMLTATSVSQAIELPTMSYSDQQGFLKNFPIDKATSLDVFNAYGPPRSKLDGLPGNTEAWTYYKYTADDVSFTFIFKEGKVYDLTNRYKGFMGPTERKARELQGLGK